MSVEIEVCSADFEARRIQSKEAGGRDFLFREQRAYLHLPGDPYPMPCQISLGERQPWPVGRYRLAPASYRVGRFGAPELARELVLTPVSIASSLPERPSARSAS
jgi:hypothetical protein